MDSLRIYTGASMNPLFRDGDRLRVRAVEFRSIRRGDVICFSSPSGVEIVHRVIEAGAGVLRTRGDNNDAPDAMPVCPDSHPLLVVAVERGGRRVAVRGGFAGLLFARRVRARRSCRRLLGIPAGTLLRKAPAWCFRGRVGALTLHRFRDDEFLYAGNRPVAHRRDGGHWRICAVADRFRYQCSELERRFPAGGGKVKS